MTHRGVPVLIEQNAGNDSGITDDDYRAVGAEIVDTAEDVWARAGLILKVKEPQASEFGYLRADQVLFTYLHLAAYPKVAKALLDAGTAGIAYETVMTPQGALPLLAPMSEVAGRMAPQIGAYFLERAHGGRGVLLGGAPGVRPARVVVLGAGNVGWNAAWIAQGMEAEVLLLDKNLDRLRWVDQIHKGRIMTLASNRGAIERAVRDADLVIGAVLASRRTRARARHRRNGRHDEAGCGDRRLCDRSRRLHREHPRDDAQRSHLCGARCVALCRRQRAGRGAEHVDLRAHQRDVALRGRARDPRRQGSNRQRHRARLAE